MQDTGGFDDTTPESLAWERYEVPRQQPSGADQCAPQPCFLHAATQAGNKIVVFGGSGYFGDQLSQLLVFDTERMAWTMPTEKLGMQGEEPAPRYGHSMTLLSLVPPRLLVFGGMQGGDTFDFESAQSGGGSASHPSARRSIGLGRTRPKGAVRGQAATAEEPDNSVYILDGAGDQWGWSKPLVRSPPEQRPTARSEHTATKVGAHELFIFGGWSTDKGALGDLMVLDVEAMTWRELRAAGEAPAPRYRHTACVMGQRLFILGGSDNGVDDSTGCTHLGVHALTLRAGGSSGSGEATAGAARAEAGDGHGRWSKCDVAGDNPFPRSGHSSVAIGTSKIAIFGGKRSDTQYFSDVHLLDVETLVCSFVVTGGQVPDPLAAHTTTLVGRRCFLFGGTDASGMCYSNMSIVDFGAKMEAEDIAVADGEASEYSFKIVVIGDAAVGKSALLLRFTEDSYADDYTSTIGVDFSTRLVRIDGKVCKLEIWDTAGQERFSTITANYYRGAQGILLVYDLTSRESYDHARAWADKARRVAGDDVSILLVANKLDRADAERAVEPAEGKLLASELGGSGQGVSFVETSAKDSTNVEKAFVAMARQVKARVDEEEKAGIATDRLERGGAAMLVRGVGDLRGVDPRLRASEKKGICACT